MIEEDLARGNTISLPITLLILFLAFGALVAASVPLVLGITAVAGALGALALSPSSLPPATRRRARGPDRPRGRSRLLAVLHPPRARGAPRRASGTAAALDASAATVGRAVVVSGVDRDRRPGRTARHRPRRVHLDGAGTMVVVLLAVIGSITVLPAMLALLGERIERGRHPVHWAASAPARRARRRRRLGAASPAPVTRAPARLARHRRLALLGDAGGAGVRHAPRRDDGAPTCRADVPAVAGLSTTSSALFPGAPDDAQLVVERRGPRRARSPAPSSPSSAPGPPDATGGAGQRTSPRARRAHRRDRRADARAWSRRGQDAVAELRCRPTTSARIAADAERARQRRGRARAPTSPTACATRCRSSSRSCWRWRSSCCSRLSARRRWRCR